MGGVSRAARFAAGVHNRGNSVIIRARSNYSAELRQLHGPGRLRLLLLPGDRRGIYQLRQGKWQAVHALIARSIDFAGSAASWSRLVPRTKFLGDQRVIGENFPRENADLFSSRDRGIIRDHVVVQPRIYRRRASVISREHTSCVGAFAR